MTNKVKERFSWLMTIVRDILMIPLVVLFPRNRRKVLFGSWGGKQYSCNPKFLFEYCCRRGGLDCVWIGESYLKDEVSAIPGARFARKGSLLSFYHFLTASFYVHNVQWRSDLLNLPRCRRAQLLYLTHGYPDKKTGSLQLNGAGACENGNDAMSKRINPLRNLLRKTVIGLDEFLYGQKSWCSVNSPQGAEIRVTNMAFRFTPERLLPYGTPRADYFIAFGKDQGLKAKLRLKYSEILGISTEKEWIVFVPTWRHEKKYLYSFQSSDKIEEIQSILRGRNAILIEKQHPKTLEELGVNGGRVGDVLLVSTEEARKMDTQELLMACDLLITDYSSVYYDYVLMERPVIHYTYDFEHFMNVDMGFNFDIRQYGGGPFAYNEDELLTLMKKSSAELLSSRNRATTEVQLSYEKGHACEGYYEFIIQQAESRGYFVI